MLLSATLCASGAPLLANPGPFTHNSRNHCLGEFMVSVGLRNFQLGLMFATALSVSMLSTASQAYSPEQQQACSPDAFRLCNADIPDVDRVTVCMIRNKSQLSPPCSAFFRDDPEPTAAAGRPTSLKPVATRKVNAKPAKPKKPAKPAAM